MKGLSIKVKLTILYTFLMTFVVCFVLVLLFSLNNQEILSNVQNQLEEEVAGARVHVRSDGKDLLFESDLLELEHGIYISVYASDGTLLYGKIPYGFDNTVPFEDGSIRKSSGQGGSHFYVMDMYYYVPDYGVVDIRGVTSITEAEADFRRTIHLALVILPMIVVVTAILSYFMTKWTLKPVRHMMDTVEAIQKDEDLSRRIDIGKGKDEIYRLAATFDRMLATIENSMKREQQFTSDVAHELRTPLSTMTLQCEILLLDETLSEESKAGVEVLYQKTKYLSQIISQLLILSRADQGRAHSEIENINFSEIAAMTAEEIQMTAQGKGISVHTHIEPDIYMHGDETLMIRLFVNLLNNAVKYGKNGGNMWVTLRKKQNEIYGEIRDDGIGISKEDLPYIWNRFYQADKSRSGTESSGLGLSMVQWIVKAHGGHIEVRSEKGQGTVFYFSFPVKRV